MVPGMFFNLRKALLPLMDDATYDAMASVVTRIEQHGQVSRDLIRTNGSSKRVPPTSASASASSTDGPTISSALGKHKRATNESSDDTNTSTKAKVRDASIEGTAATVNATQCTDGYCVPCYELM